MVTSEGQWAQAGTQTPLLKLPRKPMQAAPWGQGASYDPSRLQEKRLGTEKGRVESQASINLKINSVT